MTKTLQAAAQAPEITDAMVDAYLAANTAYWVEVDAKPWKPGVWRNGTPREATRVSLAAALATVSDARAAIAAARQERVPEQTRPAFEAWFADSRRSRGVAKRPDFAIREDGTYADDHTQRHWWTWQNAIAAPKPDVPAQATPAAGPAMQRMTPGIFKGELAMFPADDGDYVRRADALAAVAAARVPDDAALGKLLDIAAHHFTEGRYGWPSKWTHAKLLEHWRAGKPPVSDVFAASPAAAVAPDPATPDQVIDLACALEQRRALHIVAEVAALQIGGADSQTPTPFQAGYALACEEICTRLRTQQWELCGVPSPLPPAGSAG